MNEVIITDESLFIDDVEIKGVQKRIINSSLNVSTITLVFDANVEFKSTPKK
jgi:hypothetical protein